MRPPRIRVRTLTIAVAASAIALGLGIQAMRLSDLAKRYRVRAEGHAAAEANARYTLRFIHNPPTAPRWDEAEARRTRSRIMKGAAERAGTRDLLVDWAIPLLDLRMPLKSDAPPIDTGRFSQALTEQISYESEMRRKYEWLADHPWEPAAPDPPAPR